MFSWLSTVLFGTWLKTYQNATFIIITSMLLTTSILDTLLQVRVFFVCLGVLPFYSLRWGRGRGVLWLTAVCLGECPVSNRQAQAWGAWAPVLTCSCCCLASSICCRCFSIWDAASFFCSSWAANSCSRRLVSWLIIPMSCRSFSARLSGVPDNKWQSNMQGKRNEKRVTFQWECLYTELFQISGSTHKHIPTFF